MIKPSLWLTKASVGISELKQTIVTAEKAAINAVTKSNFHREFLRISGMTPTDYCRTAVENLEPD